MALSDVDWTDPDIQKWVRGALYGLVTACSTVNQSRAFDTPKHREFFEEALSKALEACNKINSGGMRHG